MRPVERGNVPIDPKTGTKKSFKEYSHSKPELLDRIGKYCSYCEKFLTQLIDVEHVLPKQHFPELETTWHNFLISCRVCNDIKGHTKIKRKDFYWADVDNTFRMFEYQLNSGDVKVNSSLTVTEQIKAKNTLDLVGLDRKPGHPKYKTGSADIRWQDRLTTLDVAQEVLKDLQSNNTPEMRNQIVRNAQGRGFWSVWMTVFKDETDMLQRFIAEFPGTCRNCFDVEGKPMSRLGGNL
jgi:uncharacterized protein (TIGR02646 family)